MGLSRQYVWVFVCKLSAVFVERHMENVIHAGRPPGKAGNASNGEILQLVDLLLFGQILLILAFFPFSRERSERGQTVTD